MLRPSLRFVLGDQLSLGLSALEGSDRARDHVLIVEVGEEATYVRHHQQKLVLVFSAMRHFAAELRALGFQVDYVKLDDPDNTHTLTGELQRALARHPECGGVVATEPGEWRVAAMMERWSTATGLPVEIRDDTRFLCTRAEFARWARDRRQLRMEYFYREMRRRTGWLMSKGSPVGGRWNFDSENRKRLPPGVAAVPRRAAAPDDTTREVIELVRTRFAAHFGDLEPFHWAVTRGEALERLAEFVAQSLPNFGDYQDAMQSADDFLFHSVLSPYLNLGLLTAREVCEAALEAWHLGSAPLNAVEGFVRQILGWREFVRGIYWLRMPEYANGNFLEAHRPLPEFYWTGATPMRCLRLCIDSTRRHAYAHHIQRLMITGNFALLAGIAPAAVEEWYLLVYADAYEWVELPNTHGMALHADGGQLGSKPYAASGAYVRRMSDYCDGCAYDPAIKTGPRACPFNYLYWHFLMRNEPRLGRNPRLAMPYRSLRALSPERRAEIVRDAEAYLQELH